MSRRRKRKKENQIDDETKGPSGSHAQSSRETAAPSPQPSEESPARSGPATEPAQKRSSTEPENPSSDPSEIPAPKVRKNNRSVQPDLELEPDDSFDEAPSSPSTPKTSLPTGEDKKEMRPITQSKSSQPTEPALEASEEAASESPELPRREKNPINIREISRSPRQPEEEIGSLDEEPEKEPSPKPPAKTAPSSLVTDAPPAQKNVIAEQAQPLAKTTTAASTEPAPIAPDTPAEKASLRSLAAKVFGSLSLLERASLGLLATILLIAAIWSTTILSASIPNTVIASKLKYPLKGESVVIEKVESYWRSPRREGEQTDEGVSLSIEVIPEVRVTLDPQSKAKALRFLFRDEDQRLVGDSSTVQMSGGKFLPTNDVTASTKQNVAIVRSTSGFQHEGELISYLADDQFQWEIVILESLDGREFIEFMAIPISATRKD